MPERKPFRISGTLRISGEFTADELLNILLPIQRMGGNVVLGPDEEAEREPESEEERQKQKGKERVRGLVQAYREKLGEPADEQQLVSALGAWLGEFGDEGESLIREGITETAAEAITGKQARYAWFRTWMRRLREGRRASQ